MGIDIIAVGVENLRGYESARLPLDRQRTLLVGPNNAGKSSILRLLDWLLNEADLAVFRGTVGVPEAYISLLTPARDTRNRARRLALELQVSDKRRHKRFQCDGHGVALLRVDMKVTPAPALTLHVGPPRRDGSRESDPEALALLELLREDVTFVLIPSFRDAASSRFRDSLQQAFRARLSERALHQKQAGAPAEYRQVLKARKALKEVAEDLARPLWTAMNDSVPPGLAQSASIALQVEPQDLVDWMASRLSLRISTGPHDIDTVHPIEVGSGLQSLLDVAIQMSEGGPDQEGFVIAVEEPEAFLHPSAQRSVARRLLAEGPAKRIISTHSSAVVAEARFDQVVVVHDQSFHAPKTKDDRRDEINTFMLGGKASEMLFYRSILFVEGEGDRLLFEALRRRVATHDKTGRADSLGVVAAGSCTAFAPWIQLARAYGSPSATPFKWLVVADGDATAEVEDALRDANIQIPSGVRSAFDAVRQAKPTGASAWETACTNANRVCRTAGISVYLSPIDLEHMALAAATQTTLDDLREKAKLTATSREDIMRELGSKVKGRPPADPKKAPWIRAYIGKSIPWSEVTPACERLIQLWLRGVMSKKEANDLLDVVRKANG